MSTWDTDDDQTRLNKLLYDPWRDILLDDSEGPPLPAWVFWITQAACIGVIWTQAVAVGMGKLPSWLGGLGVGLMAVIMWLLEVSVQRMSR